MSPRGSARALIVLLVILAGCAAPALGAPGSKWFVCKYVGTPGVDERLQTGQNPISVSESAIPVAPVFPGLQFADDQGRSLVLEEDLGQAEPAAECPEVPPPTPSPSPSASPPPPTPSPTPAPTASPSPTEPPTAGQFSVEVCPVTGEPVAAGMSQLRFRPGTLLLIALLTIRVDGQVVELRDTLGDGTVGDLLVTPGLHTWSISNAADTEVLATGEVDCPECNPAPTPPVPVSPPPGTPLPVPDTATSR